MIRKGKNRFNGKLKLNEERLQSSFLGRTKFEADNTNYDAELRIKDFGIFIGVKGKHI